MKRKPTKLVLNRETLRALAQGEMENAEGGVPPPTYTCVSRCLTQCLFTCA